MQQFVEQLCPNCGLCCNGVLFADVELKKGDDAKKLSALGLEMFKKGRAKMAFGQPCACFDGKLCGIYSDRPKYCRAFECGLLKRVNAGEMSAASALKTIRRAKTKIKSVCGLLDKLANENKHLPLLKRYSTAMAAPLDLSKRNDSVLRGKLILAVDDLMQLLQHDFLR